MRWINVKNVDELKTLGKFAQVKKRNKKRCGRQYKNNWQGLEGPLQKHKQVFKFNTRNLQL